MRGLVIERGDVCFGLGKFVVAHFQMISRVCGSQVEKSLGGFCVELSLGGVTGNHGGITTVTVNTLCVFPNIYSLYYYDPSAVVA